MTDKKQREKEKDETRGEKYLSSFLQLKKTASSNQILYFINAILLWTHVDCIRKSRIQPVLND